MQEKKAGNPLPNVLRSAAVEALRSPALGATTLATVRRLSYRIEPPGGVVALLAGCGTHNLQIVVGARYDAAVTAAATATATATATALLLLLLLQACVISRPSRVISQQRARATYAAGRLLLGTAERYHGSESAHRGRCYWRGCLIGCTLQARAHSATDTLVLKSARTRQLSDVEEGLCLRVA